MAFSLLSESLSQLDGKMKVLYPWYVSYVYELYIIYVSIFKSTVTNSKFVLLLPNHLVIWEEYQMPLSSPWYNMYRNLNLK